MTQAAFVAIIGCTSLAYLTGFTLTWAWRAGSFNDSVTRDFTWALCWPILLCRNVVHAFIDIWKE